MFTAANASHIWCACLQHGNHGVDCDTLYMCVVSVSNGIRAGENQEGAGTNVDSGMAG